MKITLFTYNAVIGVDAPLCHKNPAYIADLIARSEADMLPSESFRRPAARLRPPKGCVDPMTNEALVAASHETEANAAISADEMQANAGLADTQGEIVRARMKVRAYPQIHDEKAVTAFGRWYDSSVIQVTVVQ